VKPTLRVARFPQRATPPGGDPAARKGAKGRVQALTEYERSPSSPCADVTARPIFLRMVPERNPRTECGCQPVAFISSLAVTPPGRFSRSTTLAVLLPSRAPVVFFWLLGAFLAGLAFFPGLPFFGATWARRAPLWAFFAAFDSSAAGARAVSVVSVFDVMLFSFNGNFRDHMNHSGRRETQGNSAQISEGDVIAMKVRNRQLAAFGI
jgi:hypothetical protein